MPSSALPPLRPPAGVVIRTACARRAHARPVPETARPVSRSAAPRIGGCRERLAGARSVTRDTPRGLPPGDRRDGTTPVITELAADAVTHAAPRCAGVPDIGQRFRRAPTRLPPGVTDSDSHPSVRTPGAGSGPREHGRGPRVADVLAAIRGRTPAPPRGTTAWSRTSTRPPI